MTPLITTLIALAVWIIASAIAAFVAGPYITSLVLIVGSILFYLVIAIVLRAKSAEAFYVAERRVPAFVNGAATAADWMSAASFLSMAGAIALSGYDALPFIIGWTLGYTLMAFTVAPFIRRSETYTVPEFIETRAGGWGVARLVAVAMVFIVSLVYLTAQLVGVGVVFARFLGIAATIAVFIGVIGSIAYAWTSGWRSITWVQFVQYWVLISMYWLPVIIAAAALGLFKPFPHFAYGEIINELEKREADYGLTSWTEPFARPFGGGTGQLNWILSAIVLMLGTMGLPHILIRFYTVRDIKAARFSVGWALFFIGLLYITAPLYATIARYSLSSLWGKPIEEVMNTPWVQKWLPTGLITIKDANGDGVLQPNELTFHGDIVVVGMPDMFGMVWLIAPLVAIGGLAAALSTADGLLLAMSTALTRDVYKRFINPRVTETGEVRLARILLFVLALIAGYLGYLALSDPTFSRYVALIVGWAFVFAASSFTPTIILGIFWKRLNRYGIVAGMIAGMLVAVPYVVAVGALGLPPLEIAGYKMGTIAWGIFGFFTNLIVSIIVSLATRPEGKAVEEFIDLMRLPELRK